MIKHLAFSLLFYLYSVLCAFGGCTGSSPTWTCTPDYASVNGLINGGDPAGFAENDTVTLSSGDATWSSALALTEFLTLLGGSGTITGTDTYLITFNPTTPGGTLRISNFTADVVGFLSLTDESSTENTVIINNNILTDTTYFINQTGGEFLGVVYNNTVSGNVGMALIASGCDIWRAQGYTYGTAKALYFEDNTFIKSSTSDTFTNTRGCRYVARNNTITRTKGAGTQVYWIDMHGNQDTTSCGTIATEIYGNNYIITNNNNTQTMDQRAGKTLFFYNSIGTTGSVDGKVREEYCDNIPEGDYVCASPDGQPGHASNSYYWRNLRTNGDDATMVVTGTAGPWDCGDCGIYTLAENSSFWQYKSDFSDNSTRGMGCGTLDNIPDTCTTGVGYWATNQSCDDLTGMVGANPTTPISGTLYKCTATNTWTAYYTPYTYPHPLRGEPVGQVTGSFGGNLR